MRNSWTCSFNFHCYSDLSSPAPSTLSSKGNIKFDRIQQNHTQTAWADQIMALGQPPPSCIAWLLRGRDDVCQYLLGRPRCQAHASESRHSPKALRGRAFSANWRREVDNQTQLHRCKRCRARLRIGEAEATPKRSHLKTLV